MSPDADADATNARTRTAPPPDADTVTAAANPTGDLTPPTTPGGGSTHKVSGYEVVGELGRGGMGVVYRALHLSLGRPVALKMMLGESEDDSPGALRFLAEAAAVAAVTHPHVVGVYDYGRADGVPYLALELCGKGTLSQRLKAAGRFDPKTAAEVLAKVAEGVGAAHAAGVVHRDLKPGNVLFDDKSEPKVTDFGLAKRGTGHDLTQTNAVMGTPAYMSPEQAKGETKFVGPPADVWALGVMLYEALTGTRPFTAQDTMGLLHQVMYADPPAVRAVVKSLPPDLDQIVRKCLSKAPHERYATATELAADLRNWLDGKPVTARPPGPLARAVKWVRRNPLPTALMASLAAVVVAVGAGAYFSIQQLQRANAATADKLTAEQDKLKEAEARRAAEGEKRVADSQSAMRLALQRGAAKEAVAVFERGLADGLTPTAEMRLDRAKALYALAEIDDAVARLGEVDRDQLPPDRRGEAEMLDGLLALGVDDARGQERLRAALATGLRPADARFAEGMLAESTAGALAKFREAIKADPGHIDARVLAAVALTILSRFDEATLLVEQTRPFAPEHPFLPLVQMIVAAMRGDRVKVDEVLADCRARFRDSPQLANFETAAEMVNLIPELRKLFVGVLYGEEVNWFALLKQFLPGGEVAKKTQAVLDRSQLHRRSYSGFPPCFRRDMLFFFSELLASVQQGAMGGGFVTVFKGWFPDFKPEPSVMYFSDEAGAAKARERLAAFPEGTLKMYYATRWFELADAEEVKHGWTAKARDLMAKAGAAYEDAVAYPGIVADSTFALECAARCYFLAGRPFGPDRGRPDLLTKVAEIVTRRLKTDPPPKTEEQFRVLALHANQTAAPDLARAVLARWVQTFPNPNKDYYVYRAVAEVRGEAFGPALKAAEQALALKLAPEERQAVVGLRDRCRAQLKLPELLPPPRKAE
jgi:hypothetical protein